MCACVVLRLGVGLPSPVDWVHLGRRDELRFLLLDEKSSVSACLCLHLDKPQGLRADLSLAQLWPAFGLPAVRYARVVCIVCATCGVSSPGFRHGADCASAAPNSRMRVLPCVPPLQKEKKWFDRAGVQKIVDSFASRQSTSQSSSRSGHENLGRCTSGVVLWLP